MKICHITTAHSRYDIRIFWKECVSAARAGNEVFIIVNDDMDDEEINGITILSIKSMAKNRLTRLLSVNVKRKAYKKAIEVKADIYHFHDPELLGVGKNKNKGFTLFMTHMKTHQGKF